MRESDTTGAIRIVRAVAEAQVWLVSGTGNVFKGSFLPDAMTSPQH
jgi:hypothetical protein